MSDVTHILAAIQGGEPQAAERLLPLVYDELRKLAAQKMAQEKPGQTLQPTALVHEAFLRLRETARDERWNSRGHFFAAAAEAMRRILVENARRRQAIKHGGDAAREELRDSQIAAPAPAEELLAVHEALDALGQTDPQAAELVKLRYFVGLTMPEAAEVLGTSTRQAHYLWAYARSWLSRALNAHEREP
jgi:RNA polymerase sigma factor (TIGR02999 family)